MIGYVRFDENCSASINRAIRITRKVGIKAVIEMMNAMLYLGSSNYYLFIENTYAYIILIR